MLHIKSVLLSVVFCGLFVFCLLSSFGTFSGRRTAAGQNRFGGFGEISETGCRSLRFYYDDTSFYYIANIPSFQYDTSALYRYDLKTGQASAVCQRVCCSHHSTDCPLYPLTQNASLELMSYADHGFITSFKTEDLFQIFFWDPLTDSRKLLLDLPYYQAVSDSAGLGGKYATYMNDGTAMRLRDDLLMIGYNGEMHLYDSEMHDRGYFIANDMYNPLLTGESLCWLDMNGNVCCYSLTTGKTQRNVLKGLLPSRKKTSVLYYDYPFVWYAYAGNVYFPYKEAIYAYDPAAGTLTEITKTDKLSKESPYACLLTDNRLYYHLDGIVRCMDLDDGSVTELPALPQVPAAAVRDLLLTVPAAPSGESGEIGLYDRNGKAVLP